jgi:hypothetical protein
MIKDGTCPLASTCGHELERAFCGLRDISAKDRGLALSEDVGLFQNCCIRVQDNLINGFCVDNFIFILIIFKT